MNESTTQSLISLKQVDMQISRVGLGTWVMGGLFWGGSDDQKAEEAIETSLAEGVNFIDTAPVYGFGKSEEIVGKTIKRLKVRDKVVLATKFGLEWDDQRKFLRRNSTRKRMMQELDQSRHRLQTDVIDIYQVHWPDAKTDFCETMESLLRFYDAGIIRAIGLSNFSVEEMTECLKYAPVHTLQPPYNLFEREIENQILPFCLEKDIDVISYSALCRGMLTGKFNLNTKFPDSDIRSVDPKFQQGKIENYLNAVDELMEIAQDKKCTVSQLATSWVMHQPGITSALVGARSREQAKNNAGAFSVSLNEIDLKNMTKVVDAHIEEPISAGFMAPPRDGYKRIG